MNTTSFSNSQSMTIQKVTLVIVLLSFLFVCGIVKATSANVVYKNKDVFLAYPSDTIAESKVDYIERIYFSNQNKEGLNNLILSTLQELEGKTATSAVAVQYSFLSGIKNQAQNSENSCDLEELLAAGIYVIDIKQALAQSIPKPSAQTSGKISGVLSSAGSFSSGVNNAAVSTLLLTGGKVNSIGAASTLGNTLNTANNVSSSINTGKELFKAFKGLGLSKDKPCKNVPKKDIAIGIHTPAPVIQNTVQNVPSFKTTVVSIKGIEFSKLKTLEENIKACEGVQTTSKKFNSASSTIEVTHTGTTDALLTLMIQTSKDIFKVANIEASEDGKIMLKL